MRQTILLADDSSTIQRLVTNTFAGTRFDIVTVSNGDAAIRKFEDISPAAVLADIYMPGKNGFEVCSHIRAHASRPHTPVILLVGAFDAFDEGNARDAGASAHIKKPFEPQALIEMVMAVFAPRESVEAAPAEAGTARPLEQAAPAGAGPATPVVGANAGASSASSDDLLGLEDLFPLKSSAETSPSFVLRDEDLDKIADRVIQKLSSPVIESIAWDVVPEIATRVIREELKRSTHEG
jgi:CheY-like chemotaxis protein